jgi:nucleoside triphosphate pyrophosphatase
MRLRLPLVLASQSARRKALLEAEGIEFTVAVAAGVIEAHDSTLTPEALTLTNARTKARAVACQHHEALVLAADTLVYLDGEPLGKPASLLAAAAMLARLSGRSHQVCTGVCLCWNAGAETEQFHDLTTVTFRDLTPAAITDYLDRVEVTDKAGAYAIQDHGDLIVASIAGSHSNVVGLPMEKTLEALAPWRVVAGH